MFAITCNIHNGPIEHRRRVYLNTILNVADDWMHSDDPHYRDLFLDIYNIDTAAIEQPFSSEPVIFRAVMTSCSCYSSLESALFWV